MRPHIGDCVFFIFFLTNDVFVAIWVGQMVYDRDWCGFVMNINF